MRVIDGDTVKVDASADLPPELAELSVQLRGVDTPEKGGRAKCEAERVAGQAAAVFTTTALARGLRVVTRGPEWGKWGGRVIADLIADGRSLASDLISPLVMVGPTMADDARVGAQIPKAPDY